MPGLNARDVRTRTQGNKSGLPRVTVDTFHEDPLYPRITGAVAAILATGKIVTPVDVLVRMGLLMPQDIEDWRFGRVPYLERVIQGNLTRLGRFLRILRMHAHDLNLVPSLTAYMRWGNGKGAPSFHQDG